VFEERHLLKVYMSILVITCLAFFYLWLVQDKFEFLALALMGLCLARWYRLKYPVKVALATLISRHEDEIRICEYRAGIYVGRPKVLPALSISELNIGDQYLSVILDNNGLGYDFSISGSQQQILQHLQQVFSPDEQHSIRFNLV